MEQVSKELKNNEVSFPQTAGVAMGGGMVTTALVISAIVFIALQFHLAIPLALLAGATIAAGGSLILTTRLMYQQHRTLKQVSPLLTQPSSEKEKELEQQVMQLQKENHRWQTIYKRVGRW